MFTSDSCPDNGIISDVIPLVPNDETPSDQGFLSSVPLTLSGVHSLRLGGEAGALFDVSLTKSLACNAFAASLSQPMLAASRSGGLTQVPQELFIPAAQIVEHRPPPSSVLGRGATGVVRAKYFTARDMAVAVKVLPLDAPELRAEIRVALQLRRTEAARLECPGVVRSLGFVTVDCGVGLVMERMAGSLAVGRPAPENLVAAVLLMVCTGLCTLHATLHVVHRDLKPSNLLYDTAGTVKIADFGCAGAADGREFVGSLRNMAPERLRNDKYGTNSDVWALGLVAIELLLGRHPIRDAVGTAPTTDRFWRAVELLRVFHPMDAQRRAVRAELLSEGVSALSDPCRDFVARCLDPDPATRPGAEALLSHPFITAAPGPEAVVAFFSHPDSAPAADLSFSTTINTSSE